MGAKIDAAWDAITTEGGKAWADIGNTYQAFLKADSILPAQFPVYQPDDPAQQPELEIAAPEADTADVDLNNS
jgi:hypothetical protein